MAETIENEKYFDFFVNTAVEIGIDKFDDKLKFIIEKEWWSQEEEQEIANLEKTNQGLKGAYKQEALKSKKKKIDALIKENEKKIYDLTFKRAQLIDTTAEDYAYRKLSDLFIIQNFYSDEALKKSFYSEDDYYSLSEGETKELQNIYLSKTSEFTSYNIKCIAAMTFFQNLFYAGNESCLDFYGKPVVGLTKYQVDLFIYGKNYSNFLKNADTSKISEETLCNPERFIELVENSNKSKEELKNKINRDTGKDLGVKGTTFVFTDDKSDLEDLGVKRGDTPDLFSMAKEKGGVLEMNDLLKISKIGQ